MANTDWIKEVERFSYEAMACVFEVYIKHPDRGFAAGAAYEASKLLTQLDGELSRYIENSEVSQINNLKPGEELVVSIDAMKCLILSKRMNELTNGYFDITVDKDIKPLKRNASGKSMIDSLILNEDDFTVSVSDEDVSIDLGGIGKGYAIDAMAELLLEWGVSDFLIHGGYSSVIAYGRVGGFDGWPVRISENITGNSNLYYAYLNGSSLSSSGLRKGGHIIDPFTGSPLSGNKAVWVCCEKATVADAFSTAFMIMPAGDVEKICRSQTDIAVMVCEKGMDDFTKLGDWSNVSLRRS